MELPIGRVGLYLYVNLGEGHPLKGTVHIHMVIMHMYMVIIVSTHGAMNIRGGHPGKDVEKAVDTVRSAQQCSAFLCKSKHCKAIMTKLGTYGLAAACRQNHR